MADVSDNAVWDELTRALHNRIWQLAAALHVSPRSFFPHVEAEDRHR